MCGLLSLCTPHRYATPNEDPDSDYSTVPLQSGEPQPPASRGRAQTAHRCVYRAANGQPCHNKAAPGGSSARPHCRGHTCPHAGCTAPKRSGDSHCPDHAPAAGAKKANTGSKFQRGKQASVYLGFTSGGGNADDEGSTAV